MTWIKNTKIKKQTTYYLATEEGLSVDPWIFMTHWEESDRWKLKPFDNSWDYLSSEEAAYWLAHPDELWMREIL